MALNSVRDIDQQQNEKMLTYAHKAMIITGMALNTSGLWQVTGLTPDLQRIVEDKKDLFKIIPNVCSGGGH